MPKFDEIISKMIYDNNDEHKGSNGDILKKICAANTLFFSIILTTCNVDIIIIDKIEIRTILRNNR